MPAQLQADEVLDLGRGVEHRAHLKLLLQGAPGPYEGVLPEALQQLPPATLDQLQLSLAQLIQALKADEQAGGIPLAEL